MGNNITQFHSGKDDCVYFFDDTINRYRKICDLASPADLPEDVICQIEAAQKEAQKLLKLPLR
jgi:hypothetical protein